MKLVKKYRKAVVLILIVIIIFIFCYLSNNLIVITNIKYTNKNVPESFNNYKIVHISDLHNKEFGKSQKKLLKKIDTIAPDIIVITGDIVDMKKYNLSKALEFVEGAAKIADVYYVSGNHEAALDYDFIKKELVEAGAIVLDEEIAEIIKNDEVIEIIGVKDPDFSGDFNLRKVIEEYKDEEKFQILLSHRPELFDLYSEYAIDLVFSGHAHGGQVRLPFIGGLVAPNQGLFPEYTKGEYSSSNTTMIVSRGLGNSIIPLRVFNMPEIVVVSLSNN